MSRKYQLLDLMARKEKLNLSRISGKLQSASQQQQSITEQQGRIETMLVEKASDMIGVTNKNQLLSTHWFGTQLAGQLEQTRNRADFVAEQVTQIRQSLSRAEYKMGLLAEKAGEALRDEKSQAETRQMEQIPARRSPLKST